jgi:hypothetical protein
MRGRKEFPSIAQEQRSNVLLLQDQHPLTFHVAQGGLILMCTGQSGRMNPY